MSGRAWVWVLEHPVTPAVCETACGTVDLCVQSEKEAAAAQLELDEMQECQAADKQLLEVSSTRCTVQSAQSAKCNCRSTHDAQTQCKAKLPESQLPWQGWDTSAEATVL